MFVGGVNRHGGNSIMNLMGKRREEWFKKKKVKMSIRCGVGKIKKTCEAVSDFGSIRS
jgi:hypothetical protein